MKKLSFRVTSDILDLGIKVLTARVEELTNAKSNKDFDKYLEQELGSIKKYWQGKNYREDKILDGFRELHTKVGKSNRKFPSSPEALLGLFLETGRFPRINLLVDIYNLVSLKTRLALGAHDIKGISGNVTLRMTDGSEKFLPLGNKVEQPVSKGEYAYVDDGNNVICRMEVLQVEPTKITTQTKDIFLIIQGNSSTDSVYIKSTADELLELIKKFCGGDSLYLNSF